ncbi:uncharacterized protein [Oryza sativa Japonica Group]|uniref:uncharacterized protein n=1 Tax=Oryza sativa subsp. japonica TaxID=39947 RepID=UPI00339CEC83
MPRRRRGVPASCRRGGVARPGVVARLRRHCWRDIVAGGGRIEVGVGIVGAAESSPSRDLPWSLALSPPSSSLSRAAGRLQPPLPPRRSVVRSRRRLLQHRSCLPFPGLPSVSRGDPRSCVPAVALPFPPRRPPPAASISLPERRSTSPPPPSAPRRHPHPRHHLLLARISPEHRRPRRLLLPPRRHLLRLPLSPCPCVSRRCRPLPRHGDVALHLVHPSVSPGSRRTSPRTSPSASPELFGRPSLLARAPVGHTSTTSGIAAARSSSASFPLHPNPSAVHQRRLRSFSSSTSHRSPGSSSRGAASVVGIAAAWSAPSSPPCSHCRQPSSPPRRPRSSSSSSSRRSRSSWRSFLRQAVLVRLVRVRQVCRCRPVIVFVLGSASSSLVLAASRLRPRIAAEAVPSPFVSVVPVCLRRARSSLSFPRLVAWWLVALLVCFA